MHSSEETVHTQNPCKQPTIFDLAADDVIDDLLSLAASKHTTTCAHGHKGVSSVHLYYHICHRMSGSGL